MTDGERVTVMHAWLIPVLVRLYRWGLRAFPVAHRAEFEAEMAVVFRELLAETADSWSLLRLGWRELSQMPLAAWRLRRRRWRGAWRARPVFTMPPPAADGRFSRRQWGWEMAFFLLTGGLILALTYGRPRWLPPGWLQRSEVVGMAVLLLALPGILLGLARGWPRWAYPWLGLLLGYSLLAAQRGGLLALWLLLALALLLLAATAVFVHRRQPLSAFWQRVGHSLAVDWTRLAFGFYGLLPWLLLHAFDNGYFSERTPFTAVSVLVMVGGALVYGRCRRQDRQWLALLVAATLSLIPPVLEQIFFQGTVSGEGVTWAVLLWGLMVTLLSFPLLLAVVRPLLLLPEIGEA